MACKYMKGGFGGKSANMILFGCDFNHCFIRSQSHARQNVR